jgi:hypothetical protein
MGYRNICKYMVEAAVNEPERAMYLILRSLQTRYVQEPEVHGLFNFQFISVITSHYTLPNESTRLLLQTWMVWACSLAVLFV